MLNKQLNIGIIGYGKMGKTIERLAEEKGHKVLLKCNSNNPLSDNKESLSEIDVAIEFIAPFDDPSVVRNVFDHSPWVIDYDGSAIVTAVPSKPGTIESIVAQKDIRYRMRIVPGRRV